jgi:two-component SAPR family response regulator
MAVVFVTAYNRYAVEAFRLNALDYLMKPVTAERLRETLDRIIPGQVNGTQAFPVRIRCFGKFQITAETMEVKFRFKKAEELLTFLIDHQGDFVDRWEICDSLWEEYDGDRALINFHTTLHNLKKTLFQQGVKIPIEHDGGSYRLIMNELDCDYLRFRRFSDKAGGINQSNILEYEEVAGIYHGDYLAGKEYDWVKRNRLMLRERFIMLALQIAEYYQTIGDHQKTIAWLKQGLIQEPLHREINYRLIRTLLLANNRLLAGQYYQIYKNDLKRQLKQDPDQGFLELLG